MTHPPHPSLAGAVVTVASVEERPSLAVDGGERPSHIQAAFDGSVDRDFPAIGEAADDMDFSLKT
jgi:hypothetical protein